MLSTLVKAVYAYGGVYLRRQKPTLVYAPGRVGSMGLIKNLRAAGVFSFKVEFFETETRGTTKFVKKHIVDAGRPANVITLVRDPIDIMISYFLSKCARGWLPGGAEALATGDVPKLQTLFIREVLETKRLDSHLYWFEDDFKKYLHVSVFDTPFDHKSQSLRIDGAQFRILILRTELPDEQKEKLINTFLGTTNVRVTRENQGKDKPYGETYKKFKSELHLPSELLHKIYSASYVTHFFSPEEITALKQKWS